MHERGRESLSLTSTTTACPSAALLESSRPEHSTSPLSICLPGAIADFVLYGTPLSLLAVRTRHHTQLYRCCGATKSNEHPCANVWKVRRVCPPYHSLRDDNRPQIAAAPRTCCKLEARRATRSTHATAVRAPLRDSRHTAALELSPILAGHGDFPHGRQRVSAADRPSSPEGASRAIIAKGKRLFASLSHPETLCGLLRPPSSTFEAPAPSTPTASRRFFVALNRRCGDICWRRGHLHGLYAHPCHTRQRYGAAVYRPSFGTLGSRRRLPTPPQPPYVLDSPATSGPSGGRVNVAGCVADSRRTHLGASSVSAHVQPPPSASLATRAHYRHASTWVRTDVSG